MSVLKSIEKEIKTIFSNIGYSIDKVNLEFSNRKDLGDFQINDAMRLAKLYKENPIEIAKKIVEELEKNGIFININIAGPGFINFTLSNKLLIDAVNKVNEDIYNNIDVSDPKIIFLDYGGPNVAKALHVGHLRSANIGEALKRLLIAMNNKVISDIHLGDYGRPMGLLLLEIKNKFPTLPYFDSNYKGDYSEITLPFNNNDIESYYPEASLKGKTDEAFLEEARIITAKIQKKEKGYYDLWKKVVELSVQDIKKIYRKLNVDFDLWEGESDNAEYFDELFSFLEKQKVLEDSENAKIINVKEENENSPMPPLIMVKSNGSISYEATDMAAIYERLKLYNPDCIWYVADIRQSLHFEQVFRAARKSKLLKDSVDLKFIGFGTMNGNDGKPFKTRDGGVMKLIDLIDIIEDKVKEKINLDIVDSEDIETTSKKISIAALKYADLLPYRETDYIFNVENFTNLEGKTGPYILYSTVRIKSLLSKSNINIKNNYQVIKNNFDREIILKILELPIVLQKSLNSKSLNDIVEYLFIITSTYNRFYAENRILTEENTDVRNSWLVLSNVVYKINIFLLDILGIEVPNKM